MHRKIIVFSVAHPKHVHLFKHIILQMEEKNYKCIALVVKKDIIIELLVKYSIKFEVIGINKTGIVNKIIEGLHRLIKVFIIIKKLNPNVIIGQADPFFTIISKFLKKQFIVLPDTENAFLSNRFAIPFSSCVLVSTSYKRDIKDVIRLKSYLELAYLHTDVFKPRKNIKFYLGICEEDNYIILRFVAWNAHHDIGYKGISNENKMRAVYEFSKYGRVFISSEKDLLPDLKKYEIMISPEKMHDVLAGATLFYGESATMAAESAILGTPAIYLDNNGRGYTDELEQNYDLVYNYSMSNKDQWLSIQKAIDLLSNPHIKNIWEHKRQSMLKDKINFTDFFTWFIENYPESCGMMKKNPEYQNNFK